MEQKTNVMRILDKAKIPYRAHYYTGTGAISGPEVAAALGAGPRPGVQDAGHGG